MTMLRPIAFGALRIAAPVVLAPMSGVTDMPFRRLVARLGAGLVMSEMIASGEVARGSARTRKMLAWSEDERPRAVQLAGCDPRVMAEAAAACADDGADLIDINMGCPVKKVVNGQAGSALMRDEALAARIMAAVVGAVRVPVTLKMRTGWDAANRNAPALARIAEACGIAGITVHGRTRCQLYEGRADWAFIGAVKAATRVPVIGNGDVGSTRDAADLLRASGADGVMVGRAACGRPWLLHQIATRLQTGRAPADPPYAAQAAIVQEHYDAMLSHYGTAAGVRRARKHLAAYAEGLPGAAAFRARVMRLDDPVPVREAIDALYAPLLDLPADRRAAA